MADAVARAKELLKQTAIAANRVSLHPADVTDICTALIAEHERAERLHEALRQIYVQTHGLRGTCQMCDSGWRDGVEKHMASCLAAPLSKEGA